MKINLRELKNGQIKFEVIPALEYVELSGTKCYESCSNLLPDNGNSGCMVINRNVSGDENIFFYLVGNETGAPGNMNPAVCRLHGWRGTTNNRASYAYGWRKVLSVSPRKRGAGYTVLFSADLRPDED